jgi:hypothetical protein
MCNKRVSIRIAVEYGALPKSYLEYYGEELNSRTVRIYSNCIGQYFVEDPKYNIYRRISEKVYEKLNGGQKKPKRPNRRTK